MRVVFLGGGDQFVRAQHSLIRQLYFGPTNSLWGGILARLRHSQPVSSRSLPLYKFSLGWDPVHLSCQS